MRKRLQRLSEDELVESPVAMIRSYLWVADPRQVTFLCSRKEKSPKESAPRSARHLPPFLAPPGARKLAGRTPRASGSISARLQAPGGAAVLGARYGWVKLLVHE